MHGLLGKQQALSPKPLSGFLALVTPTCNTQWIRKSLWQLMSTPEIDSGTFYSRLGTVRVIFLVQFLCVLQTFLLVSFPSPFNTCPCDAIGLERLSSALGANDYNTSEDYGGQTEVRESTG